VTTGRAAHARICCRVRADARSGALRPVNRYDLPQFSAPDIWGFPRWLQRLGRRLLDYNLCRPYGMFIRMTGTDGARHELGLEVASAAHGPWLELPFLGKPVRSAICR
jgi:hypothetical protein